MDYVRNYPSERMINIINIAGVPYTDDINIEETIKIALNHLSQDNYIYGFTSRYDEYLSIVNEKLGWMVQNKHTNKTGVKTKITQAEIDEVTKLCTKEIGFHNKALELYKEKYNK